LGIFFTSIHDKVCFAEVLGKDPAHASPGAVREGFVLSLHAGSPYGVGVFSADGWDVVIPWGLALETLMIHIIATGETVAEV